MNYQRNSFRPRQDVQGNRFQHNFPNNTNFSGSRPPLQPQGPQNNQFIRPNFAPPNRQQHYPPTNNTQHQQDAQNAFRPQTTGFNTEQSPTRPPFSGPGNFTQQRFTAGEMRPPPARPPCNEMFRPNFPPPLQDLNRFPPPVRPSFEQQNRFPVQTNPHARPIGGNFMHHQQNRSNNIPGQSNDQNGLFQSEKLGTDQTLVEDINWVKEWTSKMVKKTRGEKVGSDLTISEAQERTRQMMVLLARLQKGKQQLLSMKSEDKAIWEQKLKEVSQIKEDLEKYHKQLTCEKTVMALKRRVEKRRKKREQIKRFKKAKYEKQLAELAHREIVHAEIDKNMRQVIEKQRLKKQEEDMKKEADDILGQVRKKISDANKTIQLLNGIQKLRTLRKDRLARQGVLSMYETPGASSSKSLMFENKITEMVSLLNKQLETYKAEEETLKVILETEQEETREKEREKAQEKQLEKQQKDKLAEYKMLFGDQKEPKPGDPLYPFWQYYCMAENSLEALVSIRQTWDLYLTPPDTPHSTCIPTHWVIPKEPSTDTWTSALQDGVS